MSCSCLSNRLPVHLSTLLRWSPKTGPIFCQVNSFASKKLFPMSHEMGGMFSSEATGDVPFLQDKATINYIKKSRLMMYLPECSDLLDRIKATYPDVKIFSEHSSSKGQTTSALVEEVEKWLKKTSNKSAHFGVINDPRLITKNELRPFGDLAVKFNFAQTYINQNTPNDFIPMFYGWFFNFDDSKTLRQQGRDLLEQLSKEAKFEEEFSKFAIDKPAQGEVDICNYFNTRTLLVGETLLHCTAFFSDFMEVDATEEYNRRHSMNISKAFELEIIGFLVTPRTFGVRLKLNDEQLQLWHDDIKVSQESNPEGESSSGEWKPSKYSPTNGPGSTAHLTLSVREETSAVQTGRDLKEIIEKEVEDQKSPKERLTLHLEVGDARCYGEGLWAIYLNDPQTFPAMFSNFYEPQPKP